MIEIKIDKVFETPLSEEDIHKQEISLKRNECIQYLNSTDYVVTKIAEAQALGEDISVLLIMYNEVLEKRKECRTYLGGIV